MILINTVPNHKKHKKIILNKISEFSDLHNLQMDPNKVNLEAFSKLPNYEEFFNKSKGTKSDFFVHKDAPRGYLDYFYSDVIPSSLEKVGKDLGLWPFEIKIHNGWFQQYTKGGEHNWHNHPDCQFTNVYFLELPDGEYKTEIVDENGDNVEFTVKEGDMLTVSSWMLHRSKPNISKHRKSVISFNTSFKHFVSYEEPANWGMWNPINSGYSPPKMENI